MKINDIQMIFTFLFLALSLVRKSSSRTNVGWHLTPLWTPFVPESAQHLLKFIHSDPFRGQRTMDVCAQLWVNVRRTVAAARRLHTFRYVFLCYNDEISKHTKHTFGTCTTTTTSSTVAICSRVVKHEGNAEMDGPIGFHKTYKINTIFDDGNS